MVDVVYSLFWRCFAATATSATLVGCARLFYAFFMLFGNSLGDFLAMDIFFLRRIDYPLVISSGVVESSHPG